MDGGKWWVVYRSYSEPSSKRKDKRTCEDGDSNTNLKTTGKVLDDGYKLFIFAGFPARSHPESRITFIFYQEVWMHFFILVTIYSDGSETNK